MVPRILHGDPPISRSLLSPFQQLSGVDGARLGAAESRRELGTGNLRDCNMLDVENSCMALSTSYQWNSNTHRKKMTIGTNSKNVQDFEAS